MFMEARSDAAAAASLWRVVSRLPPIRDDMLCISPAATATALTLPLSASLALGLVPIAEPVGAIARPGIMA